MTGDRLLPARPGSRRHDRRRRENIRDYPSPAELLRFGEEICRIKEPRKRIQPILGAMADVLRAAKKDDRIPRNTFNAMKREWEDSLRAWSR